MTPHVLDRRLVFVTGKGGVGKTSIAAALALLGAREGRRTLVCEVDAKGNLADVFGTSPLKFTPTVIQAQLSAMTMDTEESLKEYLSLQLRLPLLSRIGPLAKTFDFVATAAPGVKEILTVGKLCYEVREDNYDLVIVDASATGHVVGQLASPVSLGELVKMGVVRQQTEWMLEMLTDPAMTGVVVVTTPEEMPVNETIDLLARLDSETDIDVAAVIANRVLPELFGNAEEDLFDRLATPKGRRALVAATGQGADHVLDAARLAVDLRRARATHLVNLRERIDPAIPLVFVPSLFTRSHGIRTTRQIADRLAEELL